MERAAERRSAIEAAVADIRAIEAREGVTRASLENIKSRLLKLAARHGRTTLGGLSETFDVEETA